MERRERIRPFSEETIKSMTELKKIAQETIGLGEFMGALWDGAESLVQCEIAHRAQRRAKLLEIPESIEYHGRREKLHHEHSVRHLKRSIELLRRSRQKIDPAKIRELDAFAKKPAEFRQSRAKSIEAFKRDLLENDIEPEAAREVADIIEQIFDEVVEKKGFSGLLDYSEKQLNDLIERREKDEMRGRGEYSSPIVWWKAVAIAAVLGIAVIVVIICFVYYHCVHLLAISWYTARIIRAILLSC